MAHNPDDHLQQRDMRSGSRAAGVLAGKSGDFVGQPFDALVEPAPILC